MLRLYENMKTRIVEITHSQFAIQALDAIFSRPIFRGAEFSTISGIPTKQTAASPVRQLQEAGILKVLQPAKGRRSAMLAFPDSSGRANGCVKRKNHKGVCVKLYLFYFISVRLSQS